MANLVNFGILPLLFRHAQDRESIQPGDELCIDNMYRALNQPMLQVTNVSRGDRFEVSHCLTPRQLEIVRCGGLLNFYRAQS